MLLFINRSALEEAFISPIRRWVCVLISVFGQAKPRGLVSVRHYLNILFILNIKHCCSVIFCCLLYYIFWDLLYFLYVHRIKLTTLTNGLYSDKRRCSSCHGSPFFQRLTLTIPIVQRVSNGTKSSFCWQPIVIEASLFRATSQEYLPLGV